MSKVQHPTPNTQNPCFKLGLIAGNGKFPFLVLEGARKAGEEIKKGAEATGDAAGKAGRKVKRGTKKAVRRGARETKEGAAKVEDKTKP